VSRTVHVGKCLRVGTVCDEESISHMFCLLDQDERLIIDNMAHRTTLFSNNEKFFNLSLSQVME
jgi:hypothetical protein